MLFSMLMIYFYMYRKCNCDAAELQWRRDGGIINSTSKLPVKTLNFLDSQRENAQGVITLGKIYCAQVDFGKTWKSRGDIYCIVIALC